MAFGVVYVVLSFSDGYNYVVLTCSSPPMHSHTKSFNFCPLICHHLQQYLGTGFRPVITDNAPDELHISIMYHAVNATFRDAGNRTDTNVVPQSFLQS